MVSTLFNLVCLWSLFGILFSFNQLYANVTSQKHHYYAHLLHATSFMPPTTCTPNLKGPRQGSSLPVHHRHGPCTKHRRANPKTPTPSQILTQDQSRVNSINSRLAKTLHFQDSKTTLPTKSGTALGTGNYIVTVGIGTPKRDQSLVFDTGSDLTWIQCQPCLQSCYSQKEQIFDPTKSTSYTNVTCGSPSCSQISSGTGNPTRCSRSTCLYAIQYGDQSFSIGFAAKEKLTLTQNDEVDDFLFGCGENNQGLFKGSAGLLGLGRDTISIVSQTAQKYNSSFSYCLPSSSGSTGFLTFGPGSKVTTKYTPLKTSSQGASFYFLDLVGIDVGGKKLDIPYASFLTSGTIIDSGTVITRLPPDAYTALRTEFRRLMANYTAAKSVSILDTCYNFELYETVTLPSVSLFFRGDIELPIKYTGIMYVISMSQVCLAFAGNSDASSVGILGNVQQQSLEVVFDISRERIGFGVGGCS